MLKSSPPLSLESRYISAWNEVAIRIAQRQNALSLYITLVIGIIAALLTTKSLASSKGTIESVWLAYGFPIVSFSFACLNLKHELTILNLRRYLRDCEATIKNDPKLTYHASLAWSTRHNNVRRLHDVASGILVLSCSVLGGFVIYHVEPQLVALNSMVWWVFLVTNFSSLLMTLYPSIQSR